MVRTMWDEFPVPRESEKRYGSLEIVSGANFESWGRCSLSTPTGGRNGLAN